MILGDQLKTMSKVIQNTFITMSMTITSIRSPYGYNTEWAIDFSIGHTLNLRLQMNLTRPNRLVFYRVSGVWIWLRIVL